MSTERSRERFEVAEYHLLKMKEASGSQEFKYYLSAFLSAARSITWILDKENKRSEYSGQFVEWYGDTSSGGEYREGTKSREMKHDDLFQYMAELRNYVIKEGPPRGRWHSTRLSNPGDTGESVEIDWGANESEEALISGGDVTITPPSGSSINDAPVEIRKIGTSNYEIQQEHTFYFDDLEDHPVPKNIQDRPIVEVAEQYLEAIDDLLTEWEEYLAGELNASEGDGG